ncbi:MAG TPA: histidine phosphatase family protein [Solimonas sp.]|nr:histidine phosphatase family protein [Solimonas sp.]
MRLLTLVRHAKSASDYPELSDFERPLNERGRRDAPAMAKRAGALLGQPDRLVSSPALRAITTARVFAQSLGMETDEIAVQPKIYEAAVEALFKLVRALDGRDRHVMLFGHNPGFTEFALELATCPFAELPTCGIVQIELSIKAWSEANYGCGKVLHYLAPKD